jgi:hypothetical protein
MSTEKSKKFKFGWKEVILCVVLAAVITIFVIVFTGNTATVRFISAGGKFDAGEEATVYDYDYYEEGETVTSIKKYHEVLAKTFRISTVATLPEPEREGFRFDGWFLATVSDTGEIIYGDTEFSEDSVKNLEKDSVVTVYAKWHLIDEGAEISRKDTIIASLNIAWKGMLGIFLVTGIIYLCIIILNAVPKLKNKGFLKSNIKTK